jgi:hypothetical protein
MRYDYHRLTAPNRRDFTRHAFTGHVMDLECLKIALRTQPRRCPVCRAPDDRPPIELYNNADEGPSDSKVKKSSRRVASMSPLSSPSKPDKTASTISFCEISVAVLSAEIDDLQKSKAVLEGELGRTQREVEEARSDRQGNVSVQRSIITQETPLTLDSLTCRV